MTRTERLLITAMNRNATFRQPIVLALPAVLLWRPVRELCDHRDSLPEEREWGAPVLEHLFQAVHEPFSGLPRAARQAAFEVTTSVANWSMGEACERRPRATMWGSLAVLYWLEKATDDYPEALPENGHLHHAMYTLLTAIQERPHLVKTYDKSSRHAGRRLAKALAKLGLYVPSIKAAA